MSLQRRRVYTFCIAPLLVGCFFALNMLLSYHSSTLTYSFRYNRWTEPQFFNEIYLPGNEFADYPYIRRFGNIEDLRHVNTIEYTTATGLFGIPVMTNYKLVYKDQ
jgi:hypothetical protein